jgi:dihydrofolate reductase
MGRNIVVTEYVSLDGVVEDPVGMEGSGLGNWTGPYKRGPEGDAFKHGELFSADILLLGRRTYSGFAAVWPTVKDETGFADRINALPKYVLTSTLKRADWNNSHFLSEGFLNRVAKLKGEEGGDILVYGSASLVHLLMQRGLVDEIRMMIYPTVLGRGKTLFPQEMKANLSLAECKVLGSGIVLLRYNMTNRTHP